MPWLTQLSWPISDELEIISGLFCRPATENRKREIWNLSLTRARLNISFLKSPVYETYIADETRFITNKKFNVAASRRNLSLNLWTTSKSCDTSEFVAIRHDSLISLSVIDMRSSMRLSMRYEIEDVNNEWLDYAERYSCSVSAIDGLRWTDEWFARWVHDDVCGHRTEWAIDIST